MTIRSFWTLGGGSGVHRDGLDGLSISNPSSLAHADKRWATSSQLWIRISGSFSINVGDQINKLVTNLVIKTTWVPRRLFHVPSRFTSSGSTGIGNLSRNRIIQRATQRIDVSHLRYVLCAFESVRVRDSPRSRPFYHDADRLGHPENQQAQDPTPLRCHRVSPKYSPGFTSRCTRSRWCAYSIPNAEFMTIVAACWIESFPLERTSRRKIGTRHILDD